MEGSFLPPPHYEVRALKGLQGGKEGTHLVSTHHGSGAVLSTVRGQPCLSHQPAQWRTPGKALPHKGKEVWSETAGALPLPQSHCPIGKGNGGLAPA